MTHDVIGQARAPLQRPRHRRRPFRSVARHFAGDWSPPADPVARRRRCVDGSKQRECTNPPGRSSPDDRRRSRVHAPRRGDGERAMPHDVSGRPVEFGDDHAEDSPIRSVCRRSRSTRAETPFGAHERQLGRRRTTGRNRASRRRDTAAGYCGDRVWHRTAASFEAPDGAAGALRSHLPETPTRRVDDAVGRMFGQSRQPWNAVAPGSRISTPLLRRVASP